MKKILLLINILTSCIHIYGQEPSKPSVYPHSYWENLLLRFNRSQAMNYASEKTRNFWKIFVPHKTNEDVAPEYHRYAQEARRFFEIPESTNIEIKNSSYPTHTYNAGSAESRSIYINHDYLKWFDHSEKKYTMLHEMAHIKNNDRVSLPAIQAISSISIKSVALLLRTIFPTQSNYVRDIYDYPLAVCMGTLVAKKYQNYVERRADKQALYGLQCHKCIDAVYPSYISLEEKQAILEDVKKHQQVCSYHKSSLHTLYYNAKNHLEQLMMSRNKSK